MSAVVLKIFSGTHLGAEIELTEGVYVIGTDDSCDVILTDSSLAARHAALHVAGEGDVPHVTAEPLDGSFTKEGSPESGGPVPPRHPFRFGTVVLAWTESALAGPGAWQEVEERMARMNKSEETPAGAEATPLPADPPSGTANANSVAPSNSIPFPDVPQEEQDYSEEPDGADPKPRRSLFKGSALAAALGLAGLLCFSWQNREPVQTPEQVMRSLLDEAGYRNLKVTGGKGSVTVTGRLASDRERGRLLKLAQLLHFPVYLDVSVRSDAADSVRASFQTLGLFPEVTELPPSPHPGLLVRGYVRDGVLEEQALAAAARDVPALRPGETGKAPGLEIFRDIRHQEDVQLILAPALASAGLKEVNTEYLPGRILLHGAFTPQSKSALEEIVASVQGRLGVPVPMEIINDSETVVLPRKNANIYERGGNETEQQAPAPAHAVPPVGKNAFRITAVSAGPLGFVTLADGERVFEGGELPGGYLLDRIEVDQLTLIKNKQTTLYPLRGSRD